MKNTLKKKGTLAKVIASVTCFSLVLTMSGILAVATTDPLDPEENEPVIETITEDPSFDVPDFDFGDNDDDLDNDGIITDDGDNIDGDVPDDVDGDDPEVPGDGDDGDGDDNSGDTNDDIITLHYSYADFEMPTAGMKFGDFKTANKPVITPADFISAGRSNITCYKGDGYDNIMYSYNEFEAGEKYVFYIYTDLLDMNHYNVNADDIDTSGIKMTHEKTTREIDGVMLQYELIYTYTIPTDTTTEPEPDPEPTPDPDPIIPDPDPTPEPDPTPIPTPSVVVGPILDKPTIIEGTEQSWTQNDDNGVTFRSDGKFNAFVGAWVDGIELTNGTHYNAWSGSTYVKLLPEYLNTLEVGKHELSLHFTNGNAKTSFYVVENTDNVDDVEDTPTVTEPNGDKVDNTTINVDTVIENPDTSEIVVPQDTDEGEPVVTANLVQTGDNMFIIMTILMTVLVIGVGTTCIARKVARKNE